MHFLKTSRVHFLFVALASVLVIGGVSASEKIEVGYRDLPYPVDTGSNSRPTGEKPESKLWFNDGVWWGILWSTPFNGYRIHRLDITTQTWLDTGTVVDTRSKTRSDVFWDGTSQHLYVASHVFSSKGAASTSSKDWGRLYRFTYTPGTDTYTLDSGFPVDVTRGKSETLVIAKDSTGTLWVTYVESGFVMVNHSLNGNDLTWATPSVLPVAHADVGENGTVDDISSVIAYNGHVGIMWSRQTYNSSIENDQPASVTMNFAVHTDGADPSVWSSAAVYTASGDDHMNLKASGGRLYAAFKEEGDAKQIGLLVCRTAANGCAKKTDWKFYRVYQRKDNNGNSPQADLKAASSPNATRPSLLIDEEHREMYIFVSVEQGLNKQSTINYKKTSLDAIRFDAKDPGVPFIKSSTDLIINDPTSTKQNVNSKTGLVVLASDEEANYYFHNYLPLK